MPKHVLVIMSDQHHKGAMGCAGHPLLRTPALDALAARGTRFTQAICNFPLCGPSRASFMTGRHPYQAEVWSNATEYRSDMPTFAHAFGAAGYETVLSGRMHFVGGDQRHGFERRLIGDCPASGYIAAGWKLQDVLGMLSDTPGMSRKGLEKSGPGRSGYLAYDEAVTDATVAYLAERAASPVATAADQPLLLTVGYAMPHCPFVADPADYAPYGDTTPLPSLTDADLKDQHPLLQAQRARFGTKPLPPPEVHRRVAAAYYGMVAHLDRQVGRVLAALDAAGMAQDTLVVYTSDHGEQLGEHGCWWKSTFYEGSVGVPLLVAGPGLPAGATVHANVGLMDIGPTLLDLAGLAPLPGIGGRSFRSLLQDETTGVANAAVPQAAPSSDTVPQISDGPPGTATAAPWPNRVFAENIMVGGTPSRMIKAGTWKYNYYHGAPAELYDLAADPGETRNLADDPAHDARCAELRAAVLADWDPDRVAALHAQRNAEAALIGTWQRAKQPPEPDPVWFGDTPPENRLD